MTRPANATEHMDPELLERLQALMSTRGWSQRKAAEELNCSQSKLNQWMSDKYASPQVMNDQVRRYLDERREAGDGLVAGQAYQMIQEICTLCHDHHRFGVIIGPPGDGKTVGLTAYERDHDEVLFIEADSSMSPKVLLEEICGETGGTTSELMRHAKVQTIGKLIIIDEADSLPIKALEAIRRVFDKGKCGVVLAGEPRLERLLRRSPGTKDNLARMYSRVDYFVSICEPTSGDVEQYLDKAGIEDRAVRKMISTVGQKASFRAATKLVERAMELSQINGQPINETIVRAASRRIILPFRI